MVYKIFDCLIANFCVNSSQKVVLVLHIIDYSQQGCVCIPVEDIVAGKIIATMCVCYSRR